MAFLWELIVGGLLQNVVAIGVFLATVIPQASLHPHGKNQRLTRKMVDLDNNEKEAISSLHQYLIHYSHPRIPILV